MTTSDGPLPGGFINTVIRIGDTARRTPPASADFVERLLRHFESHDWTGAPRYVGIDEQGRQILQYLEGRVPWQAHQQAEFETPPILAAVATLVRQFHDMTAGTPLADGQEVVCHNDLSPKNTVYRDGTDGPRPVAFIDWDLAAPGRRIADLAQVCWQYVGLGPSQDPHRAARLFRVIADAYRLADRTELIPTIMWWQERCHQGIAWGADQGEPAMIRLRNMGVVEAVRTTQQWTRRHRVELAAEL
jgi:hypothetical protein